MNLKLKSHYSNKLQNKADTYTKNVYKCDCILIGKNLSLSSELFKNVYLEDTHSYDIHCSEISCMIFIVVKSVV